MERTQIVTVMDRLAFRSGSHYYPFVLKKKVDRDGQKTYTIEMKVGKDDVLVTDGRSLEEVLKRHEELVGYAVTTRHLQGRPA